MMIKKLLKITVSAAILTTMIQVTPTFAAPVTKGQIDATKDKIDNFETKIQQLDDRIGLAMEKSQKLNADIKAQQVKIKETEADIVEAQKDLDAHKKVYSERLKSIQLEGKTSLATYAEILLSSDSLSQFLNRFSAISKVMESDTDLLNGLNAKEQALKSAQEKLQVEYTQLKVNQNALASEQKRIEQDKSTIAKELANAQSTLETQEDQLAAQEAEKEAQRRAQLAAQQPVANNTVAAPEAPATPSVSVPNVSGSAAANKLIAYAKQFLGIPYVWGGSTPSGFDCSGFTSYVYRNALGINLPRVSRDQQRVGTRISPYNVKPGDLVFRGNPAYHVGIYIGNGQYIHSPQTGDVLKISSYNPAKFTSASSVISQ